MPPWVWYIAAGLLLSPVFTLTPYLEYVGWFLKAVVHETGHTLYAWLVGCPALPRLSLAGHAATTHGAQYLLLALAAWAGLGYLAYLALVERQFRPLAVAAAVLYPLVAFQPAVKELGHLLSGHLGELAVAGIFLWQARTGLFTSDRLDRIAYAWIGCYLVFANAYLCFGIAYIPAVLREYETSGSYGFVNDYLRAADLMQVHVNTIVLAMLLVTIAVLPLALWVAGRTRL